MKTASKEYTLYCDGNKEDYYCHKEITSILKVWEKKPKAYSFFKRMGWYVSDDKDLCPYCREKEGL